MEVGAGMGVGGAWNQEPGTSVKAKVRDYRDLRVWQCAMDLIVECYSNARRFPKNEVYGLTSQLQRAAVSVASNIAEGNGRASTGAYVRHLSIANGSLMELETQVRVARRLSYLSDTEEQKLLALSRDIGKMLSVLTKRLRGRIPPQRAAGSRFPVPGPS